MSNISELRKEAARYNTPATYAKCAKCQRQINAMEKQLFTLEASDGKKTHWQDQALKTVRIVKVRSELLYSLIDVYYHHDLISSMFFLT